MKEAYHPYNPEKTFFVQYIERAEGSRSYNCDPKTVQGIELVQFAGYPVRNKGRMHRCAVKRVLNQQRTD
jgi:hypothetical protein